MMGRWYRCKVVDGRVVAKGDMCLGAVGWHGMGLVGLGC